jgi:type VI secretion system protein ImpF
MAKDSPLQVRASLFDRLVDWAPGQSQEVRPLRAQTLAELRNSVLRDVSWLLNTRTHLEAAEWDRRELTVIDYGLPDFGSYSPSNVHHRSLLAQRIKRAIEVFEPRLMNVTVQVDAKMLAEKGLRVTIDAVLAVDEAREPVSFMTIWESGQARMMEVYGA